MDTLTKLKGFAQSESCSQAIKIGTIKSLEPFMTSETLSLQLVLYKILGGHHIPSLATTDKIEWSLIVRAHLFSDLGKHFFTVTNYALSDKNCGKTCILGPITHENTIANFFFLLTLGI